MPRRAKTKTGRVGPYDLTTIKLPGGTEMEALGVGFLHQKTTETLRAGYRRGYAVAALSVEAAEIVAEEPAPEPQPPAVKRSAPIAIPTPAKPVPARAPAAMPMPALALPALAQPSKPAAQKSGLSAMLKR